MYSDRKDLRHVKWLIGLVILLVLLIALALAAENIGKTLENDASDAIRETILTGAHQCYCVEGMYPASLDYLQEHYGIQINTDDYYITYSAFASNLPPSVTVTKKS